MATLYRTAIFYQKTSYLLKLLPIYIELVRCNKKFLDDSLMKRMTAVIG